LGTRDNFDGIDGIFLGRFFDRTPAEGSNKIYRITDSYSEERHIWKRGAVFFEEKASKRLLEKVRHPPATSQIKSARSFDSGSLLRRAVTASQRNYRRAQHLAFAQDDGAFF
jgi:hypothetical protein